MTLLFYLAQKIYANGRYTCLLRWNHSVITKEYFQDRNLFLERLCMRGSDCLGVVAAPSDQLDLSALVAQKELFWDLPLVLFLPDENMGTVEQAYRLRPRFVAGPDSEVSEALAVLERLIVREKRSREGWRSRDE
jgi:hypothetical protein